VRSTKKLWTASLSCHESRMDERDTATAVRPVGDAGGFASVLPEARLE